MSRNHAALLVELGGELNALLVASRLVMGASAAQFHAGLQPAAYQIAVILSSRGPTKAGRLVELLGMDKSAVSRLAKSLCANGLADVSADPEDGRANIYRLTVEGEKKVQASNTVKSDAFFSRLDGWSNTELLQFITSLRRFNQR